MITDICLLFCVTLLVIHAWRMDNRVLALEFRFSKRWEPDA